MWRPSKQMQWRCTLKGERGTLDIRIAYKDLQQKTQLIHSYSEIHDVEVVQWTICSK